MLQGRNLLKVFPQKRALTATPAKDSSVMASLIWLVLTLPLSVFCYVFNTAQLLYFISKCIPTLWDLPNSRDIQGPQRSGSH